MDDNTFSYQEMDTSKINFSDQCPRRCQMWRRFEDCIHMYDDNTALKPLLKYPEIPRKLLGSNHIIIPTKDEFLVRGCYDLKKVPTVYRGFISIVELHLGKKKKKKKKFIPQFSDLTIQECVIRHAKIKRKIIKLALELNIFGNYDDIVCSIDKYWRCTRLVEDSMQKYNFWTGGTMSKLIIHRINYEMRLWFAENMAIPMLHGFRNKHPNLNFPIIIIGSQANPKEITETLHKYLVDKLQLPKNLQEILSVDYPYLSELAIDYRNRPKSYLHKELEAHSWLFDLERVWSRALLETTDIPAIKTSEIKGWLGITPCEVKHPHTIRSSVLDFTFGIFRRHILRIRPTSTYPVLVLNLEEDSAKLLKGLQVRGKSAVHAVTYTYPHSYII